jgi:hypothetical protein
MDLDLKIIYPSGFHRTPRLALVSLFCRDVFQQIVVSRSKRYDSVLHCPNLSKRSVGSSDTWNIFLFGKESYVMNVTFFPEMFRFFKIIPIEIITDFILV